MLLTLRQFVLLFARKTALAPFGFIHYYCTPLSYVFDPLFAYASKCPSLFATSYSLFLYLPLYGRGPASLTFSTRY